MKQQLHPGAKWHFRVSGYFLFGFLGIFLGIWVIAPLAGVVIGIAGASTSSILTVVILSIIGYILFVVIVSEIYARMTYNRWFYEIEHDSIRLERGIIWKKYSNIPYERVQNVDIHRGIIARMCGFSSLLVQTAGYSMPVRGGYGAHTEGYIPAIDMNYAEQLREYILKRIKGKHQGL